MNRNKHFISLNVYPAVGHKYISQIFVFGEVIWNIIGDRRSSIFVGIVIIFNKIYYVYKLDDKMIPLIWLYIIFKIYPPEIKKKKTYLVF